MKKILIVDDSFTIRKVIDMLLKPLGYELSFAENAAQALSMFEGNKFDLVLIDYGLPDKNGILLTEEIKTNNPFLPVLLMISSKEALPIEKIRESRCDDHVEKPFDSQTFLTKVENLLSMVIGIPQPEIVKEQPEEKFISIGEDFEIEDLLGKELTIEQKLEQTKTEQTSQQEEEIILDEIEELEEVEELMEVVEEATEEVILEEPKKEIGEISIDDLLGDELNTDNVNVEGEKAETEELEILNISEEVPKTYDEAKVNLEDFFSDLNDVLRDEEKVVSKEKKKVAPVIEEVAKGLREIGGVFEEKQEEKALEQKEEIKEIKEIKEVKEDLTSSLEDDIWNFEPEIFQKTTTHKEYVASESLNPKDLENIVKEITYDIVEKIAWEIVPEVIDNVIKDKFSKK